MADPRFSILIPLYNEERCLVPNLRRLLAFLAQRGLHAEILLGSNGSTDATVSIMEMLRQAAPETIHAFHIEERGLVGRVFAMAARMASSPFLISIDADLSVDLEFIPNALALLEGCDIVVGSKQSGRQKRSVVRLLGSRLFILCAQALLGLQYDDYSIGAKGYRLEQARPLLAGISEDTGYVLDILYKAHRGGLCVAVLPVACTDWRKSRFRLLREGLVRFSHLFRVWIKGRGRTR